MNKTRFERLSVILVFGSIWGIIEATLGYILHLLPALIAGSVMFPIVLFILLRARRADLKRIDLVYIGFIAALIKGVNLFMPAGSIFKTINPMISIVFEALVIFLLIPLVDSRKIGINLLSLPLMGILWRGLYLLYMVGQFLATGFLANQLGSATNILNFLVLGGVIDGAIALVSFGLDRLIGDNRLKRYTQKLWLGIPALGLAVLITIVL